MSVRAAAAAASAASAAHVEQAKACRTENSCSGNLDRELKGLLQSYLPQNAWEQCRNKGYISISAGSPLGPNQALLVTDFQSQDDLISAATASSFIPLWSASSLTKGFRGFEVFDGGYTLQQPCPPDVTYCIRVSSKNPAWPQNRGIGSLLSLLGRLGNTDDSRIETARTYPPIEASGANGQPDPQLVQLAAASNVDIAPGVFSKMPFSQSEWSNWALSPADDGTLKHMYKLGKADAEIWAKYSGIQVLGQGLTEAEQQPVQQPVQQTQKQPGKQPKPQAAQVPARQPQQPPQSDRQPSKQPLYSVQNTGKQPPVKLAGNVSNHGDVISEVATVTSKPLASTTAVRAAMLATAQDTARQAKAGHTAVITTVKRSAQTD